jgi:integrase/recombinase XerC
MKLRQARAEYVRWLSATKNLSPHTVRAYEVDITAFERHFGSSMPVERIDHNLVLAFVGRQRDDGLSAVSVKRRASGLRGLFRWLVAEGRVASDPWAGVEITVGHPRKLPRVLSADEISRLLDYLREKAGVCESTPVQTNLSRLHQSTTLLAISLMVMTGVRVHEVVGIECPDIDLAGRSLRLVGKGRRERHVYLTNGWITDLLGVYLSTRATLGVGHTRLLFNLHLDPLSTPALRRRLARAAQAAGLRSRVTPHMLRHTAATQLIEAGVDIRFIQRLLGHASLSTTEIYTHVSDRTLKRAVSDADILGRLVGTDN